MEDKQDGNADSSHVEDQTKSPREIPPWAQGTNLRNVEKDVLIPKIMREKAKIKCKDLVDEFAKCAKGRTVSMLWNCMSQNDAMKECLTKYYQDPEFYDECKEVYLKQREEFQKVWSETGKTKLPKKKDSAMF